MGQVLQLVFRRRRDLQPHRALPEELKGL
ncbi:rCG22145 [Rattus norvegicus]|uniref:RCG22145 n=1 Tax=Rattus norvegicus TaxID=10116 RepID=A6K491_RAT|nr:rCG22145 [Rattus norvegicus]